MAEVGQLMIARRTSSSRPAGSPHTTATPSSSNSKTPGAQNAQFPEPIQASRIHDHLVGARAHLTCLL